MLLPLTYGQSLLALSLAALLWGTWANMQKLDRKWRFELYAFDFAVGALLLALLSAMTLGNSGTSASFTFEDSLTVGSKRNMALAIGAGIVYFIGHMMILAGLALAGMSTAMPVAAGITLAVCVALGASLANPTLAYCGVAAGLAAVVASALAQKAAAPAGGKVLYDGWKGFILSAIGGLIVAASLPIAESTRAGDIGIGSYAVTLFMTLGLLLMTPLVNIYFLNLPVQGAPMSPRAYLKGTRKQHLQGIAGGALWAGGTVAFFAALGGAYRGAPSMLSIIAFAFGGAVVAGICGLTIWREHADTPKAKMMLWVSLLLLAAAAALIFLGT